MILCIMEIVNENVSKMGELEKILFGGNDNMVVCYLDFELVIDKYCEFVVVE